jgi:hypothetical protein
MRTRRFLLGPGAEAFAADDSAAAIEHAGIPHDIKTNDARKVVGKTLNVRRKP